MLLRTAYPRLGRSWSNVPGVVGARLEYLESKEFCSSDHQSFRVQRARMFPTGNRVLLHVAMHPRNSPACRPTFSSQFVSGGSLSTQSQSVPLAAVSSGDMHKAH